MDSSNIFYDFDKLLNTDSKKLDLLDPLAKFRERFVIDDLNLIYLDGNSLGRLPVASKELVEKVVIEQWGNRLIRSWNEGWLDVVSRVGDKIGKLVGAQEGEVLLADSTTVCLYKAAVSALLSMPKRSVILTDDQNFPSDIQALRAAADAVSGEHRVVVVKSDGIHGPVENLIAAFDDNVALVSLSQVSYRSGWCWEMQEITDAAHEVGALILWDLSHSVGVVPINLRNDEVDLAVGCTYKYLNGGPGAPAFIYISEQCSGLRNPIAGWYGSEDPFSFNPDSVAQSGNKRFLTGTPPIVSASLIEPGVDLIIEAGIKNIREKSVALSEKFLKQVIEKLLPIGLSIYSPMDHERRGSHISVAHPDALAIGQALIHDHSIIPDVRPPDLLRFGFSPLYTTFSELEEAIEMTIEVVSGDGINKWRNAIPIVP